MFLSLFQQGKDLKNNGGEGGCLLFQVSIPFSAGALAVQAGLSGVRMPAWQGFLSLFRQEHWPCGRGLNNLKPARLARLSIPFSEGQRHKVLAIIPA